MTPAPMRTCCRLSKILSLAAVLALVVALCVTCQRSVMVPAFSPKQRSRI